jgi:hypothetical protein
MGSRTWIKVYAEPWLDGSIRQEAPEVRAVFIDLLVLAGSGRFGDRGEVKIAECLGFSDAQLAKIIGVTAKRWRVIRSHLAKAERISVAPNGVITITNWKHYQSEYERQKPNRKLHQKVTGKVTTGSAPASYGGDRDREEKESNFQSLSVTGNGATAGAPEEPPPRRTPDGYRIGTPVRR